ncbi:MAG: hypothetical protein AAGB00_06350 [Planctomycetota bacterium]
MAGPLTDALWTLLAFAATGVTYDWQPAGDGSGGVEYIVQVEPELIEAARSGQLEAIESNVPAGIGPIRRIRVVLGGSKSASDLAGEGGREHSVLKPTSAAKAWPVGKRHTVRQSGANGQPLTPFTQSINNAAGQLEQGFQQASQGVQGGYQQAQQAFTNAQNTLAQPFANQPVNTQAANQQQRTLGGEVLRGAGELRDGARNVIRNTGEAIKGTTQNLTGGLRSVLTGGDRSAPAPAAAGSNAYVPYSYNGNAAGVTNAPAFANTPNPALTTTGQPAAAPGFSQQPSSNFTANTGGQNFGGQGFNTPTQPGAVPATGFVNRQNAAPPFDNKNRAAGFANQAPPLQAGANGFDDPRTSKSMAPPPPSGYNAGDYNRPAPRNAVPQNQAPSGPAPQNFAPRNPAPSDRFGSDGWVSGRGAESSFIPLSDARNRGAGSFGNTPSLGDNMVRVRNARAVGGAGDVGATGFDRSATGPATGPAFPNNGGFGGNTSFDQGGNQAGSGGLPAGEAAWQNGNWQVGANPNASVMGNPSTTPGTLAPAGGGFAGQAPLQQPGGPQPIGNQNANPYNDQYNNQYGGQFGGAMNAGFTGGASPPMQRAGMNTANTNPNDPWLSVVFFSLLSFGSVAGNFFLGWSYLDARNKYQSALRRTVRTFSRGEG